MCFFFNPGPVWRVPIPNRYTAKAKLCFCKNNKRTIIKIRTSRENGIYVVEVKANDVLSVLPRLETKLLNGGSLTIDNLNERVSKS